VKGAPGRSLGLSRVIVPVGAELALHRHQGTQVAYVQSGVLTYHVKSGSVRVLDGSPDENPTVIRKIDSGETGKIRAGQWIVEQRADIHRAANRGNRKVKIYLATLLRTGAPPSTPVD
jgi:quercetin dioxygenase-like cupin family protein